MLGDGDFTLPVYELKLYENQEATANAYSYRHYFVGGGRPSFVPAIRIINRSLGLPACPPSYGPALDGEPRFRRPLFSPSTAPGRRAGDVEASGGAQGGAAGCHRSRRDGLGRPNRRRSALPGSCHAAGSPDHTSWNQANAARKPTASYSAC